jgi:hypothetical protein
MSKWYITPDLHKWKKEAGEIPENTCPDIDKLIESLELLRQDNAKLRELGVFWYEKCEELSGYYENELEDVKKEMLRDFEDEKYDMEKKIRGEYGS